MSTLGPAIKICSALGSDIRVAIMLVIAQGEANDIPGIFDKMHALGFSPSEVVLRYHLDILEDSGLIEGERTRHGIVYENTAEDAFTQVKSLFVPLL